MEVPEFVSVLTEFTAFQRDVVNADQDQVDLARERRDAFITAFSAEDDVAEVFCSGSLRRRTQLRPIHDVDLVIVYRHEDHPDWGSPGTSSTDAMRHVQSRVTALLGQSSDSPLVRITRVSGRGRSVKCFIDTTDTSKTDAFTVDAMPVLRNECGSLLLPSQHDEEWSEADPEFLINEVRARQDEWSHFRQTVRLLKYWARQRVSVPVKSLVVEVLALHHLPTDAGNVPEALRRFFTAAAATVSDGVEDPAGFCGPVQLDLDDLVLRNALELAADHAEKALVATSLNDQNTAISHWREVLGPEFAPDVDGDSAGKAAAAAPVAVRRPVRDAPQG